MTKAAQVWTGPRRRPRVRANTALTRSTAKRPLQRLMVLVEQKRTAPMVPQELPAASSSRMWARSRTPESIDRR